MAKKNKYTLTITVKTKSATADADLKQFASTLDKIKKGETKDSGKARVFTDLSEEQLNQLMNHSAVKNSLAKFKKASPAANHTPSAPNPIEEGSQHTSSSKTMTASKSVLIGETPTLSQSDLEYWQQYLTKLWCLPFPKDAFRVEINLETQSLVMHFPKQEIFTHFKDPDGKILSQTQLILFKAFIQKEIMQRIEKKLDDKKNNHRYAKVSVQADALSITVTPLDKYPPEARINNMVERIKNQFEKQIMAKAPDKSVNPENAKHDNNNANTSNQQENNHHTKNAPANKKSIEEALFIQEIQALFKDIAFPIDSSNNNNNNNNNNHHTQPAIKFTAIEKIKKECS